MTFIPCPKCGQLVCACLATSGSSLFVPLVFRAAWECPRCGVVNAPHVDRCACAPVPVVFRDPNKESPERPLEFTMTAQCSGCGGGPDEGCSACRARKTPAAVCAWCQASPALRPQDVCRDCLQGSPGHGAG